jgi:hypothetical protein
MQAEDKTVMFEELELIKNTAKANRLLRSESARAKRKELKQIRETRILNEWAKQRRERKQHAKQSHNT